MFARGKRFCRSPGKLEEQSPRAWSWLTVQLRRGELPLLGCLESEICEILAWTGSGHRCIRDFSGSIHFDAYFNLDSSSNCIARALRDFGDDLVDHFALSSRWGL